LDHAESGIFWEEIVVSQYGINLGGRELRPNPFVVEEELL
jgi:hypothetical protein